ncbi:MAG TPA: SDR family NAD(P)-dependent oxidoreductase [Acidimicrobiales bacterium]|nr:SDR family NAD(P)-dependent oxidoreductase [Acidimicrobiales bacterium]
MGGVLEGRIAAITGGTDGIGKGLARAFLDAGASVSLSGRSGDRGTKVLAELGVGDRAQFVRSDATDREQAANAVRACVDRYGAVDILVNNVGGAASEFNLVHQLSDDGWESGLLLNLHSAFWATREALGTMVERGWGRIINISSVEGKVASLPAIAPYVVGKHALQGLTKSVAVEYGELGITCNAICPGAVETDTFVANAEKLAATSGGAYADVVHEFVKHAATKRLSTVQQIAAVAMLLASDAGANVTGVAWSIDGGTAPW